MSKTTTISAGNAIPLTKVFKAATSSIVKSAICATLVKRNSTSTVINVSSAYKEIKKIHSIVKYVSLAALAKKKIAITVKSVGAASLKISPSIAIHVYYVFKFNTNTDI